MSLDPDIDIDEVIAVGMRWLDLQERVESYGLKLYPGHFNEPSLVRRAWEVLTSDVPLRETYPDGDRAVPPFTPRQALKLATFEPRPLLDHTSVLYDRFLNEVRQELGRHDPRRCGGQTASGSECSLWAMPYAEEPRCHHHAPKEAIDRHERLKRRERQLLVERLREEGLVDAL